MLPGGATFDFLIAQVNLSLWQRDVAILNWGKPDPIGPVIPTITEFEKVTTEFKLQPDQYITSTRLREWVRRNKNSKFVPEPLLEEWGFEIESTL